VAVQKAPSAFFVGKFNQGIPADPKSIKRQSPTPSWVGA
jgi:hypothetical protein